MQDYSVCICCLNKSFIKYPKVKGVDGNIYTMNICTKCGFGGISPSLTNQELKKFYSNYKISLVKSNIHETLDKNIFKKLNYAAIEDCLDRIQWCAKKANKQSILYNKSIRYLDVGCGYGFSVFAGRLLNWNSLGLDYDKTAIALGKKNLALHLKPQSLENFAKNNKSKFDVISEWQTLEHVNDIDLHVKSINSLLIDEGIYILTVPNFRGIYSKLCGMRWYMIRPPEHLNYFTEESLKYFLKRSKFEIIFIGTSFKTASPLINFGIRRHIANFIHKTKSLHVKYFLRIIYRIVTLTKRYLFYLPINAIIYFLKLGGNSLIIVCKK